MLNAIERCQHAETGDGSAAVPEPQSGATVFVVDDYDLVREALRWLLEAYGMAVRTYASAEEFLADYDPERPGCLLLDVVMPGMSGLALLDAMRARRIKLPVILISGSRAVDVPRPGVLAFLEKPFSDEVLLQRIRQAVALDARRRRSTPTKRQRSPRRRR